MILNILKKISLLQSLVIMITISLLLPLPLIVGVYVNVTYQDKQEKLFDLNSKKFELTSKIFTEALWNYYPSLANTMLDQLILDKNIMLVEVKDSNNKNFLYWNSYKQKTDGDVVVFEKELVKDEQIIGTYRLEFKKISLVESIMSDLTLFSYIAVLQVLFFVSIISFIYYYKILKPIKKLLIDSNNLSQKNFDAPFSWTANDELGTLGVALDKARISLKNVFNTLEKQNENLDEKVKQRTVELENANKYKSEFLANMSHEIRTPMNAIVGMCHLVSQTKLNNAQINYIDKIKDASSVLLYLINDILDFSKIEAGKIQIENVAFDLHKELKKSVSIFSVLAKEKNLELEIDYINSHRFYRGDPYRINQILNNFLSNAIKFTSKGKVSLVVKDEFINEHIHKLNFIVKDSGIGISESKINKLFNAFTQIDASTTRKYGGTGLGLYISTELASMMNGQLNVRSEEDIGSEFSFEVELPSISGAELHKESTNNIFKPLNILLIENDEDSILILDDYIRSFGFFLTAVASYEEALEKIEEIDYDLFLIDYHLDGINGIAAYEKLKNREYNKKVPPAIMITIDDDIKIKNEALGNGFEKFLIKPVNPSFLYDDITAVCDVNTITPLFDPKNIDLSSKKILIVEDNEINLEVATYLLVETKVKIDIARNGLEAVEKVKEQSYDAIFMDIQMPIMDGFEATTIIRNELKSTIPIIAMTANVMAHDVAKCLEVGMNEHIGKPFDIEDFYETLLKVFADVIPYQKTEDIKKEVVCTKDILDKHIAIKRLGNNEDLWLKMVKRFYTKYEKMQIDLDDYLQKNDLDGIKIYFHTLKGLAGSIGAMTLSDEAKKLEQFFKTEKNISKQYFSEILSITKELLEVLKSDYKGN